MQDKMRYLLQNQIDRTTYYLLRKIEANMTAVDVTTNRFILECSYFKMCLWAELMVPLPSSKDTDIM